MKDDMTTEELRTHLRRIEAGEELFFMGVAIIERLLDLKLWYTAERLIKQAQASLINDLLLQARKK